MLIKNVNKHQITSTSTTQLILHTLLSSTAWYPPVFGTSCPARVLAPLTFIRRPLRGSMKDSPSRTPPTGSTAPAQL